MTVLTCSFCGAGFAARSDALYCSPACRQKAHRARTARRTAEGLTASPGRGEQRIPTVKTPDRAVAGYLQRARDQVDRSRELRRRAERGLQRTAVIRRELMDYRRPDTVPAVPSRGVRWPGN
jgi:hypothetical protein